MSHTERCLVREFKLRMRGLEPGDVLAPLSPPTPPGFRILVLDRAPDGALTLSYPCEDLRIVADPKGPFHWHEEDETIVDGDNNPHEFIDLNTMVTKGEGLVLASEYRELSRLAGKFKVLDESRIHEIMSADTVLRRSIDAMLFNAWLPSTHARVAAALELIIGRPLTEDEQAHAITLVSCLARAVPVLDVTILRSDPTAEVPSPHATH